MEGAGFKRAFSPRTVYDRNSSRSGARRQPAPGRHGADVKLNGGFWHLLRLGAALRPLLRFGICRWPSRLAGSRHRPGANRGNGPDAACGPIAAQTFPNFPNRIGAAAPIPSDCSTVLGAGHPGSAQSGRFEPHPWQFLDSAPSLAAWRQYGSTSNNLGSIGRWPGHGSGRGVDGPDCRSHAS